MNILGTEPELLTDIDMFHTNKNRISEVVTKPVMQYTKANNLYIKNFDPEKYSYFLCTLAINTSSYSGFELVEIIRNSLGPKFQAKLTILVQVNPKRKFPI